MGAMARFLCRDCLTDAEAPALRRCRACGAPRLLSHPERDELTIARDAAKEDIEAAALKLENVVRAVGGRKIKKIVVVPQRIVNVVA